MAFDMQLMQGDDTFHVTLKIAEVNCNYIK
jgi:hypothetical protein